MNPRFLSLTDVAEMLGISAPQAYALVRSGELPAIQIGGRGQWRVEHGTFDDYVDRLYAEGRAVGERTAGFDAIGDDLSVLPHGAV